VVVQEDRFWVWDDRLNAHLMLLKRVGLQGQSSRTWEWLKRQWVGALFEWWG